MSIQRKINLPLAAPDGLAPRIGICKMATTTRHHRCALHEMKLLQASKIQTLSETLIAAGFITLADQAQVLGIPRSTAWTIMRSAHKGSGLSAATINHMLSSPTLPASVRVKIIEYIKEKSAGRFGHSGEQLRRFNAQINAHAFYDYPIHTDRPSLHSSAHVEQHQDRQTERKA